MMKKRVHSAELYKKALLLGTALCLSVALPALATSSNFSTAFPANGAPPVEASGDDAKNAAAPTAVSPAAPLPPQAAMPLNPGDNIPPLDITKLNGLPSQPADAAPKLDSFGKPVGGAPALADLPPPVAPESSDQAASPVPELPKLGENTLTPNLSPAMDNANLGFNTPLQPTALPEIKVTEKPKTKTWMTTLAPSSTSPETRFNYRRDLLPATIYRTEYKHYNKHLPVAVSHHDYENMLFASVVRNDVERTRALLNAGTYVNVVSNGGETPLAAARRVGAEATAQLLIARGGRY